MLEARRTRAVLIALLVVAIALITIDFRDGGTSNAHSLGGRIFGPVEHLAGDATGVFRGAGNANEVANLQKLFPTLYQPEQQVVDVQLH